MTTTATKPTRKRVSPRKRAQRFRIVQYAILVIAVIFLASVADFGQIRSVFFRGDMIKATLTQGLGRALLNTIMYTLGAFVLGLFGGTLLALMRLSSVGVYRWLSMIYIEFFRGLPALVVLLGFGLLPLAFPGLETPGAPRARCGLLSA